MAQNVIHSLCATACVPFDCQKMLLPESFIDIEDLCIVYIVERHFILPHLFRLRLHCTLMATACLSFWTSWYLPSSYRYWLCRVPVNALLSHYDPRKIVELFMVTWRLLGFLADLSQRCRTPVTSSSLPTGVCVISVSLAAWVTTEEVLQTVAFQLSFLLLGRVPEVEY